MKHFFYEGDEIRLNKLGIILSFSDECIVILFCNRESFRGNIAEENKAVSLRILEED
jgi:hypothetical protein